MEAPELSRPRDVAVTGSAPPRPFSERELRFARRRPVRWFSPSVLAVSGMRVLLSYAFGAYLDKRELQAAIEAEPLDHRTEATQVWVDYLADTGDGFAPTYTMAWVAAQEELTVPGLDRPLPRGGMLVLGGDQVYPVAGADEYENRFIGPFRASLPWTEGDSPELLALAGNHDWYDGLTSFVRIFCQRKWVGGRRTRQSRSYFAVRLPHRWWVWGIDIQFGTYIDEPQLRYFERAAALMDPGDRVVLCTAEPSWVDCRTDPEAFRNLAYVESRLIAPTGARLMLTLSGDSHHYAHYAAPDGTHKVTAGGGGAFLHPTHDLDATLDVAVDPSDRRTRQTYTRTATYPERSTSRRLGWGAVGLALRNPSFLAVPAVMYLLLGWSSQFSLRAFERRGAQPLDQAAPGFGWIDIVAGLTLNPISAVLTLVVLAGLIGFAKPPRRWARDPARLVAKVAMGALHTLAHLVAVVLVGLLAVRLVSGLADQGWFTFWLFVAMGVLGGLVGGLVTGLYLALSNVLPGIETHGNEAFSAMRLTGYKNFLRLHVDHEGLLHVYPLGVRRAVQRWRPDPDATVGAPWLAPVGGPPAAHLIEPSFTIDGRTPL